MLAEVASRLKHLVLGVVVATLLVGGAEAAEKEAPRRLALLVGCSEYPHLLKRHGEAVYRTSIQLKGPENDVRLLRETLIHQLGHPPSSITTLAGWPDDEAARPTRANILHHLDLLAKAARKGDSVFIMVAGHGSQQMDDSGDELDGMDEIFLPADVTDWDRKSGKVTNAITDDEIGEKLAAIRKTGARIWVVMDCCHSGTATRGARDDDIRERRLDPAMLGVPEAPRSRGGGGPTDEKEEFADGGDIVAFYAAPSHRTAPEMPLPRGSDAAESHGLLSYTIASLIGRLGGDMTFEELHARVVASYQALPYHGCVPQADGNLRLSVIPGATGDPARRKGPVLLLKDLDGELTIENAGLIHGLVEGAVLEVYEPGRLGQTAALLGRVVIEEAGLSRSICVPVEGGKKLPELEGARALCPVRVVERPFGDQRLRIVAVDETGKPLAKKDLSDAVAAVFAEHGKRFPLASKVSAADWILEIPGETGAPRLRLRPVQASGAARPFALDEGDLLDVLSRIFRVENLKRLAAGGMLGAPEEGLRVEIERLGADGASPLRNGTVQRPGDRIRLIIQNETAQDYDLWVFFIDADYGLDVVFPGGRHPSPRLGHRDSDEIRIGPHTVSDTTLGAEHVLVVAIPQEEENLPVWLDWLAQGKLERAASETTSRGAEQGGAFGGLLEDLAFGTRMRGWGVSSDIQASVALLTWRTDWGRIEPPAAFGESVVDLPAAGSAPEGVPAPWLHGARASLVRSGRRGHGLDVVLSGGETPDRVWIDVDGNSRPDADSGSWSDLIAGGRFDAEIAFWFRKEGNVVAYDRNDDGTFDLVLIDRDRDGTADTGHRLGQDGWVLEKDLRIPWLATTHLDFVARKPKLREAAQEKIRRILAR